jgi:hypothetical protein
MRNLSPGHGSILTSFSFGGFTGLSKNTHRLNWAHSTVQPFAKKHASHGGVLGE